MEMWTSDQLPKCTPTSCASIPNATFSPALVDGHLHCNSQEFQTQPDSGQDLAHASLFPQQEKDLLKPTNDTSGQSSSISSRSANLTRSLASKLQARLGRDGLMEYKQTWSQKTTPAGRQYWAHTASGHRISANDSTRWPTPMANKLSPQTREDFTPNPAAVALTAGWPTPDTNSGGDGPSQLNRHGPRLQTVATWASPQSRDWKGPTITTNHPNGFNQSLPNQVQLVGWLTPSANEDAAGNHGTKMQEMLGSQVRLIDPAGWSTPSSRDYKDSTDPQTWNCTEERDRNDQLGRQVFGIITTSSHAETENRGALNANHAGWLMGFPLSWTLCGTLVQLRSKSKRQSTRFRSSKSS